jgi:hypothetical protein
MAMIKSADAKMMANAATLLDEYADLHYHSSAYAKHEQVKMLSSRLRSMSMLTDLGDVGMVVRFLVKVEQELEAYSDKCNSLSLWGDHNSMPPSWCKALDSKCEKARKVSESIAKFIGRLASEPN